MSRIKVVQRLMVTDNNVSFDNDLGTTFFFCYRSGHREKVQIQGIFTTPITNYFGASMFIYSVQDCLCSELLTCGDFCGRNLILECPGPT